MSIGGQLALDGFASGSEATGASSVSTGSFSTSKSPDVVVVMVSQTYYYPKAGSSTQKVTAVTDSQSHLTFTRRGTIASSNGHAQVDEWYAIAAIPLSGDAITAALAGTGADAAIYVYGVSGANTAFPFDSAVLPVTVASTTSPIGTTISTNNPNDILLFGLAAAINRGQIMSITAPSGTTSQVNSMTCDAGGNCVGQRVDYEVVSTTQSSVSVGWGVSSPHSMAGISDAIVQATGNPATVKQPIEVTFSGVYGGAQQTVSFSDSCSENPSTFPGDGASHSITMSPGCIFSLSLP
jgi:hypothetical protein